MSLLPSVAAAVRTALDEIPEAVTVRSYLAEVPLAEIELPALLIDIGEPSVSARSRVREISWPIDIWVLTAFRSSDVLDRLEDELAAAYLWPERIIDKLDSKGTFNGLLTGTTSYADPAVTGPFGGAFSPIPWAGNTYLGCIVHAMCATKRVGGFA